MSKRVQMAVVVLGVVVCGAIAHAAGDPTRHLPRGEERVELDPADFSTRIDNAYWPMRAGDRRVYRVSDPGGDTQRVVARVTRRTKLIANGVRAREVYTTVSEAGRRVEDNRAWYAQDRRGNVWYLGELARELVRGGLEPTKGSWEAGVDGAQPGVVMPARPKVGLRYRQEYFEGVAEDRSQVFSRRERVEVPVGSFRRVLLIRETEGIERALLDYKFYARGVGPVLGLEVSGGSGREELVSFHRGAG